MYLPSQQDYTLSALVSYWLLSIVFGIFVLTPILGDKAPTSEILRLLSKNKKLSRYKLYEDIKTKDFLRKRLSQLERMGLLVRVEASYKATRIGLLISIPIKWYMQKIID